MKTKILASILLCSLIFCALPLAALANFGSGAAVLAEKLTLVKSAPAGEKIIFSDSDFKSALGVSDFGKVTIQSLPTAAEGTLLFAGRRAEVNQVIKRRSVPSLVFLPASDSVTEARFTVKVEGHLDGRELECILRFTPKVNKAPTLDESGASAFKTQERVSVFGTLGARDPEGDRLEYLVAAYAEHGALEVKPDGSFVYTPVGKFSGEDSFSYVVRDEWGNWSEIGRVSITVEKRVSDAVFHDMTERSEYGAALYMDALGIMKGTEVDGLFCFLPDKTLTRAEFLSLAMKSVGIEPKDSRTWFDDDADIPSELAPYVNCAARAGLVNGDFGCDGLVFRPNDPITKYEAAEIIAKLAKLPLDSEAALYHELASVPKRAREAVAAMYTIGILSPEDDDALSSVTRADAASFIKKLTEII